MRMKKTTTMRKMRTKMKKSRNTPHGFKAPAKGGADFKRGKKTHSPSAFAKAPADKFRPSAFAKAPADKFRPSAFAKASADKSHGPYPKAQEGYKSKSNEQKYDERHKPQFKKRFEAPKVPLPYEKAADDKYSNKEQRPYEPAHKPPETGTDGEFDQGMKLQQYLAHAGITSRRKAEEIIAQGRVMVNGKTVTDVTARVRAGRDHVKFDGSLVHQEKPVYIVMNKPEGYISAITDNENRKTVVDILKPYIKARIYPVGRLDFNTTGTLLLTNDGDFANKVMHPKFEIEKRYVAKIKGRMSSFALKKLVSGVRIEDGKTVKALNAGVYKRNDQNDLVFIVIKEGMNHQVKRMLQAVGASVVRLRRESIGLITDKGLNTGQWRFLTPEEIKYLTRG